MSGTSSESSTARFTATELLGYPDVKNYDGLVRFVQYYLDCLSQASYLIGDETTGRAAVVDPRRDVQEYLDDTAASGLGIDYVIETHVHADFLSGHLELAAATGATIVYGEAADLHFPHRKVADGERIELGQVSLEFRATPGHTPESICIVVWEAPDADTPYGVLTGDTLFIGDVGRPDLLSAQGQSPEHMARQLYRSLHTSLLTLPDATRVYPAHGAGSACGKNLSTEKASTIGEQRRSNYALRLGTAADFVAAVTEGQPPPPGYFARVAGLNRESHQLAHVEEPAPLSLDEVLRLQAAGAAVLDVRSPEEFARGHLRGSVNVGLDGRFAEYAAEVVGGDIIIVCEPGRARDARLRLARVGLDSVIGALDQPVAAFVQAPRGHRHRQPPDRTPAGRRPGRRSRPGPAGRARPRRAGPGLHRGQRAYPPGPATGPDRRARSGPPARHVLRWRLPVLHRGQPAPCFGLR